MNISATPDVAFQQKGLLLTTVLLLSLLLSVCVQHSSAQCVNVKIVTLDAESLIVSLEEQTDSQDPLVLPPYYGLYPAKRSFHSLTGRAQHTPSMAGLRLIRGPPQQFG